MSFQVVHCGKVKKGGLGGMRSHLTKRDKVKTNPDIDLSLSQYNYNLLGDPHHLERDVNRRIKELQLKRLRKDAVILEDVIVGASQCWMLNHSKEERDTYFKAALRFFQNRYGKENVIYARSHVDEPKMHIHIGIIPVTKDKRLCAKEIFSPRQMVQLQTDFFESVGKQFGLARGIHREKGQKDPYVDVNEIKGIAEREAQQVGKMTETIDDLLTGYIPHKSRFAGEDRTHLAVSSQKLEKLRQIAIAGQDATAITNKLILETQKAQTKAKVLSEQLEQEKVNSSHLRKRLNDLESYASMPTDAKSMLRQYQVNREGWVRDLQRDCVRSFLCSNRNIDKAVTLLRPQLEKIGMKSANQQREYIKACLSAARSQSAKLYQIRKVNGRIGLFPRNPKGSPPIRRRGDIIGTWIPAPKDTDFREAGTTGAVPSLRLPSDDEDQDWSTMTELAKEEIYNKRSLRNL